MKTSKLLLFLPLFISNAAFGQSILQVQRTSQNPQGQGVDAGIQAPIISPNSDAIVFGSQASNLVTPDTNGRFDIFLQNFTTGNIIRISDAANGEESDGFNGAASITPTTANGFFAIAFESNATNLGRRRNLFPDLNDKKDIYLAIPRRSSLERISVGPAATQANGDSETPSATVLPKERQVLVAYSSRADNLHPNDTLGKADIFIATVSAPGKDNFSPIDHISTFKVTTSTGAEPNDDSVNPQISANGQFVVFESVATNMVAGTPPTTRQIYLFDRLTGNLVLVSRSAQGEPGNDGSKAPSISFNGKFVIYATRATNIVADGYTPPGDNLQFIRFNTQTGESARVNTSSSGEPGNGDMGVLAQAVINADGRFALFSDTASNLVPNDLNAKSDIFIKDMLTSNIVRVSTGVSGEEANAGSFFPTFARTSYNSDFGRATWASNADNIIPNDTEGRSDIFLSTLSIPPVPLTKDTVLEVPPDTTLSTNNKKVVLKLQSFAGVSTAAKGPAAAKALVRAAKKVTLRYLIKLEQLDVPRKKADRRDLFSKRNEVSFKSLKQGNYSVKYQAQMVRGKKVVSRTPFSPASFFNTENE